MAVRLHLFAFGIPFRKKISNFNRLNSGLRFSESNCGSLVFTSSPPAWLRLCGCLLMLVNVRGPPIIRKNLRPQFANPSDNVSLLAQNGKHFLLFYIYAIFMP